MDKKEKAVFNSEKSANYNTKSKKQKVNSKNLIIGIAAFFMIAVLFWSFYGSGFFDNNEKEIVNNNVPDSDENLTKNVLAEVNENEITTADVKKIQQSFLQQGQQVSQDDALDQAINQEIFYQKAKQENYEITSNEAEKFLGVELNKQNKTLEDYKQQLEKIGISYDSQLKEIKEQIAIQNYLKDNVEIKNITEEEAEAFYENYKSRINSSKGLPSFQDSKNQIMLVLQQQKQQRAISSLAENLRQNASINYE